MAVLAQEFFKQKLKLKTEQEKQWNKFAKMSITELQVRSLPPLVCIVSTAYHLATCCSGLSLPAVSCRRGTWHFC